jgi:long-chain acyl-CoA synthetase
MLIYRRHLDEPCLGRGEVFVRGPSLSSGYYADIAKTKESFDEQGWFHTGDIALWTTTGKLQIVDRLKNLVKLKSGEYVAIEAMEAVYGQVSPIGPEPSGDKNRQVQNETN